MTAHESGEIRAPWVKRIVVCVTMLAAPWMLCFGLPRSESGPFILGWYFCFFALLAFDMIHSDGGARGG